MTYSSLTRQIPPSVEPVTLSQAKAHLRVDDTASDVEIVGMIQAAREWVEAYLNRTLVHTQWVMRLQALKDAIELPRPPAVRVGTATAVTITYTAAGGDTHTLSSDSYRVSRHSTPAEIYPVYGGTWPSHRQDEDSITVTWWAGYSADGSGVPAAIRSAMLMLISHFYHYRTAMLTGTISKEIEFGVRTLLDSQKWGSYA